MFFKKIKKNTQRYHYFTPAYQKSRWYDLLFLRYRVWQTEIGNFGSVFALLPTKNLKNQNFEKMGKKNCWRYHNFTHVYQTPNGCLPLLDWIEALTLSLLLNLHPKIEALIRSIYFFSFDFVSCIEHCWHACQVVLIMLPDGFLYQLFHCPRVNFRSMTIGQPHSPMTQRSPGDLY